MPLRVFLLSVLAASLARAGGGPETTLVVVNAASPVSRHVANEYVRLRSIPQSHVVYLEGVPHLGAVSLDSFLENIWAPVREHMAEHGIADRIDLITYSADFPYAVDFRTRRSERLSHASLTGVTYLIRAVQAEEEFWDLRINRYFGITFTGARRATSEERSLTLRANKAMQERRYGEARKAFEAFLRTYKTHADSWYNYACCLARLGEKEPAYEALEKAAKIGFNRAPVAAQDADLASLRGTQRFRDLLKRMGNARPQGPTIAPKPSRALARGDGYYLSTQLGYTGRYGNSVPEILAYLRAAAASDGTSPLGTVYICRNGDIRSKAREPFFATLLAELERRGRKVELLDGVLPTGKADVIGAVVGKAGFSWAKSKSSILPGAICEHLTSHGANFGTPGQTKIAEFLRFGAAGSSGTVIEPYAIHQKFPNPLIHVFYADGCSLAEAFYQSVWGPYQLMVAGDGLARPFAKFVRVDVDAPPAPWKGIVQLTARAPGAAAELWVDGDYVVSGKPGTPLPLDTTLLHDGHHDVRLVVVAGDAVATRSYARLDAVIGNHGHTVTVEDIPHRAPSFGQEMVLRVKARRAAEFQLWQGSRKLAKSTDGKLVLETGDVGPGPFRVTPRVLFTDGSVYRCAPLDFAVDPTNPVYSTKMPMPLPRKPGARGEVVDAAGERRPVVITNLGDGRAGRLLRDQVGKDARRVELDGWIEIRKKGLYQLVVNGNGRVKLVVPTGASPELELAGGQHFLPLALEKGWYPLSIELESESRPHLELMLGGDQVLAPLHVQHFSFPALKTPPTAPREFAALLDGKRDDPGANVGPEGLVLSWKRPAKGLAAVTIFPAKGAREFALDWSLETSTGYGKFKPVKDLQRVVAPPPRTAKDQPSVPLFLEFSFKPVRAKKLRLSLKGQAQVAELEVLGAARR
ncbi:MAG: TPR end-of-group domain-containing protein [Planctomycetota bacterium]|jgi:tetratricopeptide (TPR) repeat protein